MDVRPAHMTVLPVRRSWLLPPKSQAGSPHELERQNLMRHSSELESVLGLWWSTAIRCAHHVGAQSGLAHDDCPDAA